MSTSRLFTVVRRAAGLSAVTVASIGLVELVGSTDAIGSGLLAIAIQAALAILWSARDRRSRPTAGVLGIWGMAGAVAGFVAALAVSASGAAHGGGFYASVVASDLAFFVPFYAAAALGAALVGTALGPRQNRGPSS